MARTPSLSGKEWNLVRKIGEGVTGVVYLVEVNGQKAILKEPAPSILDAQRQAPQITNEGNILTSLLNSPELTDGLPVKFTNILGRSLADDAVEKCYLLMERAPGFSLTDLARVANFGIEKSGIQFDELSNAEKLFLRTIESNKHVPDLIVLRSLDILLNLFPRLHNHKFYINNNLKYGLIWNDVKPDHLYWDIATQSFTIIDWGNSQFLEQDYVTRDRQFSPDNDYRQFASEMGKFLGENNSKLRAELGWHTSIASDTKELHKSITGLIRSIEENLEKLHLEEDSFLSQERIEDISALKELRSIQEEILLFGSLPNYGGAIEFCEKIFQYLIIRWDLGAMEKIALWPIQEEYPNVDMDFWGRLAYIVGIVKINNLNSPSVRPVMWSAIRGNWLNVYWHLWTLTLETDYDPDWWNDVGRRLRAFLLEIDSDVEVPLKILYGVQTKILEKGSYPEILRPLDSIIKRWRQVDPAPPNAGLEYKEVKDLLEKIDRQKDSNREDTAFFSEVKRALSEKVFYQINVQETNFFLAWGELNFEQAKKALQILTVWDPDRRRIQTVDRFIEEAKNWVAEVRHGDEDIEGNLLDWIKRGQDLLIYVGNAKWLELYINFLEILKNGEAAEILSFLENAPKLFNELSWLWDYVNNIKRYVRERDLKEFYDLLKEWKWSIAEELLSRDSLQPWKDAYENLIEAMQKAREGEMKLNKKNEYAPEDKDWREAEDIVNLIYSWRVAVRDRGCQEAKKILAKSNFRHEWKLLEFTIITQEKLNIKQTLFNSLEQGNWNQALELIGDIPEKLILADVINEFKSAKLPWFWRGMIKERLLAITEHLQKGKTLYTNWKTKVSKDKKLKYDYIVLISAADWKGFEKQIIDVNNAAALALETEKTWSSLSNRDYKSKNVDLAKKFLDDLTKLESFLGNDPEFSLANQWLDTFKAIERGNISKKKNIQQIGNSHPLQQWLLNAPNEGFRSKDNSNLIMIGAAALIIIICACFVMWIFRIPIISFVSGQFQLTGFVETPNAIQTAPIPATADIPEITRQPETTSPSTKDLISCDDLVSPLSLSAAIENNIQSLSIEEYNALASRCQVDLAEIRLQRLIYLNKELQPNDKLKIISDAYRRLGIEPSFSEMQGKDFVSQAQWMRTTLALCELRRKTNLASEQVSAVQEYLDWHLGKYPENGANYFGVVCRVTPENFKSQLQTSNTGNTSIVDLGQSSLWPTVDWSTSPCFYYDSNAPQLLMSDKSERESLSFCALRLQEEEFKDRASVTGIKTQFCGYELPADSHLGYGVAFLQNDNGVLMRLERSEQGETAALYQIVKDKLIEIDQSTSYADSTAYSQIVLPTDQCVYRETIHPILVGNLIIWKVQIQDLEQEKTLGLFAGLLDRKLINEKFTFGFASWLPLESTGNIRFSFSEFILEKSGGLR
jgi:serine/threonine protein kinase